MSKTAYENALARREELRREMEKVEQFLALYQEFESPAHNSPNSPKPLESDAKNAVGERATQRRKSAKKVSPAVLKDYVAAILKESGRPLSRREIVHALEAKKVPVPGENKTGYIGSLIHRFKDEISRADDGGYWFTGYGPGQAPESRKNN